MKVLDLTSLSNLILKYLVQVKAGNASASGKIDLDLDLTKTTSRVLSDVGG